MTGVFIRLSISLIVSYFIAPIYEPLNPYSTVGSWMTIQQIHGSLIMLYCILIYAVVETIRFQIQQRKIKKKNNKTLHHK